MLFHIVANSVLKGPLEVPMSTYLNDGLILKGFLVAREFDFFMSSDSSGHDELLIVNLVYMLYQPKFFPYRINGNIIFMDE